MPMFIKSIPAVKGKLLIRAFLACMLLLAFSLASIPARAGDAEDKANQAFADWKAAQEAVNEAKEKLAEKQKKLLDLMAGHVESGTKKKKKQPPPDDPALAKAREDVAAAAAALAKAEAALLAARVALEKALAELPEDSELKKELKRQRNDLIEQERTNSLSPQIQQIVQTKTAGGLQVTTFDTSYGRVVVNLPDDMMAGDTISGTVVAEPKGQTPEERAKNMLELNGYVIEFEPPKKPDGTSNPKVTAQVMAALSRLTFTLPPTTRTLPLTNVSGGSRGGRGTTVTNMNGSSTIGRYFPGYYLEVSMKMNTSEVVFGPASIPIDDITLSSLNSMRPHSVENHIYQLPAIGQQGRPLEIYGPFDGSSSNTMTKWCVNLTPSCENDPKTGGVIQPLAESPRKLVITAPVNISGPIEIQLNEGTTETRHQFRNVGVNLTAPKTSLLKGESTTLKIEVSGLQGITEPVPLHLVKGGVVTMQGGDVQSMTIKPAEVQSNGTFSTTRGITGVEAGVWNATATVVVFDTCLQDDNSGDLVVYSSATGDFIFCQGRKNLAGANPISLSTLNFGPADFTGGVRVSAGDINGNGGSETSAVSIGPGALMYKNGALTVADFNYKPGYLHVQIDSYNHTGNASGFVYQQITVPSNASPKKINFTITDRDTRNNTCSCR